MAANFWESSQCKNLLSLSDLALAELHEDETARGITSTDLRLIKIHFCDHIQALKDAIRSVQPHIKVRQRVLATALYYLRRVFIKKSVLELDPRLVALACVYLASKSEECPLQAKSLIKAFKAVHCRSCGFGDAVYEMRDILEMEMRLLHVLDYNLITFHPYRPLTIFMADATKVLGLPNDKRERLTADAWAMVNDSFKTDLCLLHPPHIIAAGCIHLAGVVAQVDLQAWFCQLLLDVDQVRRVSLVLLDHYEALSALSPARVEAALKKLPPVPSKAVQGDPGAAANPMSPRVP